MNLKKAKRIRKAVTLDAEHTYHPNDERKYEKDSRGTVTVKGMRKAYQLAKKAVHQAGLA